MGGEERVQEIIRLLEAEYPDARIALNFSNPFELLVAVMLSAQSTDERVNQVTKTLFKKYRKPEDYVKVDLEELERDIRPTGYYRNKARNLKKCCEILVEKYNSEVPRSLEELIKLPGVGRKTANMVLSNAYGIVEGIAVDTHVRRVARRLGLTRHTDPEKIELDLMEKIPKEKWARITDLLIFHGRRVCSARKPKCSTCVLNKLCPSAFKIEHK
ncbi:endonuclease III [Candidatus Bathyarchaeota archaeon]|nr:endonuclease III [Candidatus Bathyarchaeota archaeon]RLE63309.1 MAG: endonuclease III [Thermoprotei archaeon]